MGTSKQRRNDIKLLTILAEAFSKNELIWRYPNDAIKNAAKYCEADVQGIRDAEKKVVVVGVGMERYNSKSMPELLDPVEASVDKSGIPMGVIEGIRKISDAGLMKKRNK